MSYSVDLAYLDYFKNATAGLYDSTPIENRLKATGLAAGTALVGGLRTATRVIKLVIEIEKVIFYSLASFFTLGNYNNFDRLKDHCKLLALNAAGLGGQPLQVIIHSLAIVIGIISPAAAYRTMQIGTKPIAQITSRENEIWQQYKTPEFSSKVTEFLLSRIGAIFNQCPFTVQIAMKTLLNEFSYALDSALVAPIGYMDQFHSFEANPKTLTDEQKKLTPILLLNGNYSHQGTFLPLLYTLKSSNNQRPVYTINLPPNTVDPHFILSKIEDIKRQYGKTNEEKLKMDVVGHSMGSHLIQYTLDDLMEKISLGRGTAILEKIELGRVITVGTPFFDEKKVAICSLPFDIMGAKDCLSEKKSILSDTDQATIKTGHLGLLFHRESLNKMKELLALEAFSI